MGNVKDLIVPEFKTPEKMEVKHTHASIALGILSKMDSKASKVAELGCGNAVVLVLMAKLNPQIDDFVGIEINEKYCEVAREVVRLNDLSNRIKIINANITESSKLLGYGWADYVVFNPPFHNDGKMSYKNERFVERNANVLDEFVASARDVLKYGHKFFAITSTKNMITDLDTFVKNKMIPKTVIPIYGKLGIESKLLFWEGKRGGKSGGFKVNFPVFLNDFVQSSFKEH